MDFGDIYTSLFNYVKNKETDKFIDLFNKHVSNKFFDINIHESNNKYFINYAVATNNIELVKFLLSNNVRIDVETDNVNILVYSIIFIYNDIVELLLDYNTKRINIDLINYRDINSKTPIMYAIEKQNMGAIKLLLEYNANVDVYDNQKFNAVYYAIYSKNDDIFNLVLKYTKNINFKYLNGENALHVACKTKNSTFSEVLIKNGIDINVANTKLEITPIHYSVINNDIVITELLLKNNADCNIQDISGNTPIHTLLMENESEYLNNVFMEYIETNKDINVNLWNLDNKIILHYILYNNIEIERKHMEMIIDKSNLNFQDNNGNTCFYLLMKNNLVVSYENIIRKKKINILLRNKDGEYIFDLINKSKDKDIIYKIVVDSYLFVLQNTNKKWNQELDMKCYAKMSDKDTELCKKKINDKIMDLVSEYSNDKDSKKCYDRTYPVVKPPVCISVNEGKKITFCSFIGSLLDILIGLIYLQNKYNDEIECLVSNIGKSDICTKMNFNDRCELSSFEIVWANKKLLVSTNLIQKIMEAFNKTKKKFIIIPIGIDFQDGSHAGYLIYDIARNELERFETYGGGASLHGTYYDPDLLDTKIESLFRDIKKDIKYVRPKDYLPKISFQLNEIRDRGKKNIGDPQGFCALWSIWYVENRIKYSYVNRDKLANILITNIKEQGISFKNLIRNYAENIISIRDSILNYAKMDINDWINEQYTQQQYSMVLKKINEELAKN